MRSIDPEVKRLLARPVNRFDVKDALRIVDDSGVAAILEREMPKASGRPRIHTWRSVLSLFILSAICQETGAHVFYSQKVWWGLKPKWRRMLGFTHEVAHSTIDRYLQDLVDATTEQVNPDTGEVLAPRLSVPALEMLNRLLRAAVRGVEETPEQAIDSMPLESWAYRRGWKRDITPDQSSGPCTDYGSVEPTQAKKTRIVSEPGWPIKLGERDYQPTIDPDARDTFVGSKNLAPSRIVTGFDLHVSCDVSPHGESGFPQIPRGFFLTHGNGPKDAALISLIDTMTRLGSPLRKVMIDRGYTQLNGVGLALSRRQIEMSLKLKGTQTGAHGTPIPGAVLIDGRLFVDWMPQRLWKLPNFDHRATKEETALLSQKYDERTPYAFEPKGKPDWERGVQQYRGPAATHKVRCANNPETLRLSARKDCPSVSDHEAGKPLRPCACGAQPRLGPKDDLDLRQRYVYGTPKWLADHSRRSSIEASNANFTTHISSLGERKSVRITSGMAKRTWMTCFAVIAVAVTLIRSRYAKSPSTFAPGETVRDAIPRPRRKDKNGNLKRTLNEIAFTRRKPRRNTGTAAKTATGPPGRPTGPAAWAKPLASAKNATR